MTKQQGTKKERNTISQKRNIKLFWGLFSIGLFVVVIVFLSASWGVFGNLPDETSLENPEKNLATEIISIDGKTIGKFYKENRTPVNFKELPRHLVDALIATEDIRFFDHSGIDARGTLRAIAFLGSKGGASTITQQLAKLFFTENASKNIMERILQKSKEWVIAIRLEERYTKEEIITMYFNEYDFLNQAIGIESAAHIYFDKAPKDLTISEAAILVGMFKNSSLYNPIRNPVGVKNRRNVVLSQMAKYKFISDNLRDSIQNTELDIKFTPQGHDKGIATYFREYTRNFMHDWSKKNSKADSSKYNIYSDGLKIYTTIDSKMQEYAENAVNSHMRNLQNEFDKQNKDNDLAPFREVTDEEVDFILKSAMKRSDRWREMKKQGKSEKEIRASFYKKTKMEIFAWGGDIDTLMTPMDSIRYHKSILQASLMSMTPQTGEVKAWVGGIDYKYFKYDMVKRGKRQIGSTFKPFVYATVIDQMHMSPCDTLPNTLHTIEVGKYGLNEPWTPKNSSDKYGGMLTLKAALAQSVNTVTARLIDRVGPKPVLDLVGKMGVDTKKILEVPSIALGTPDVSLYEMVGAYSTFANQGVYIKPSLITRIEDKNGTVLFQHIPEARDVLSEEAAYVTISLMEGVTQSGSGQRLRSDWALNIPVYKDIITGYPWKFTNSIAGKTGTTQNQSDGWFMGVVPNLATGVWVGGEDRSTHFSTIAYGQGASMALPIWANYMKDCYNNEDLKISKEDFTAPEVISIETDCEKWKESQQVIENEYQDEF